MSTPSTLLPITCSSRIRRVVVYARGAVVTRRVELPSALPDDATELRIGGISALAEAGSFRAIVSGEREVTALRSRVTLPEPKAAQGALAERLRDLRLERARLEQERKVLRERRGALSALGIDPRLARAARRTEPLDPASRVADALAMNSLVTEILAELDLRIAELDKAIEDNRLATEKASVDAAQGRPDDLAFDTRSFLEALVRLGPGSGAPSSLELEYAIGAARWWPAYTARLSNAASHVEWLIEAFVAQDSGEDWRDVELCVSTADLTRDARLPELRSLRIGRAQAPARKGYRPPPPGLEAMFESFDRSAKPRLLVQTRTAVVDAPVSERDEEADFFGATKEEGHAADEITRRLAPPPPPAAGFAPPMPQRAPMPMPEQEMMARSSVPMPMVAAAAPKRSRGFLPSFDFGGGGGVSSASAYAGDFLEEAEERATAEIALPEAIEPEDEWLDFDALELADPLDRERRGRLVRAPKAAGGRGGNVESIENPYLAIDPVEARGMFDHRYDAEGLADIPSNRIPHRIALLSAEVSGSPRFVSVPREAAEVYREVLIENPFNAPLLAGPVEVFVENALLCTSSIPLVDRGGRISLGLGIEERLRVARNTRIEESTAGLLGGSTVVDHVITIDLSSSLGQKATIDVLERIPVTDDKDIEIKLSYTKPSYETYTQVDRGAPIRGGVRMQVEVPAGGKSKVELGYRLTLPSKNELVGGNRRE